MRTNRCQGCEVMPRFAQPECTLCKAERVLERAKPHRETADLPSLTAAIAAAMQREVLS